MSYKEYVIAAYAVFAAMLAWDFISAQLGTARELRAARRHAARLDARNAPAGSELQR